MKIVKIYDEKNFESKWENWLYQKSIVWVLRMSIILFKGPLSRVFMGGG